MEELGGNVPMPANRLGALVRALHVHKPRIYPIFEWGKEPAFANMGCTAEVVSEILEATTLPEFPELQDQSSPARQLRSLLVVHVKYKLRCTSCMEDHYHDEEETMLHVSLLRKSASSRPRGGMWVALRSSGSSGAWRSSLVSVMVIHEFHFVCVQCADTVRNLPPSVDCCSIRRLKVCDVACSSPDPGGLLCGAAMNWQTAGPLSRDRARVLAAMAGAAASAV